MIPIGVADSRILVKTETEAVRIGNSMMFGTYSLRMDGHAQSRRAPSPGFLEVALRPPAAPVLVSGPLDSGEIKARGGKIERKG